MDDSHVYGLVHGCEESLSVSSDRLSELPDSLILEILSLLPMRDVVGTTLLSKRWKDLWTTVPSLDFRNPLTNNLDKFRRFVCGALARWKGLKIVKFGLSFWLDHPNSREFVDLWLIFSIEKQVEDLNIDYLKSRSANRLTWREAKYYAPQFLYSCSSIRNLCLVSCKLEISENVQWNQLKSLTIRGGKPLSEVSMNHILTGSPQLEVLNLSFSEGGDDSINIQSTSLKMLKIHAYRAWIMHDGAEHTMLRIWAPNLQTLEISAVAYRMCVSLDVPSLTTAILRFRVNKGMIKRMGRYIGKVTLSDYSDKEKLWGISQSILHVEKVTLSYVSAQVFLKMKKKYGEIASNAKFLKLISARAPDIILGVVEMFPRLTMLVIECNERMPFRASEESDALDSKNICRLLQYLKTIEITWPLHDPSIYLVVEILLRNAHMLEKMVFRPLTVSSPESMFLAEERVKSMPRSSPTAVLIFRNKY